MTTTFSYCILFQRLADQSNAGPCLLLHSLFERHNRTQIMLAATSFFELVVRERRRISLFNIYVSRIFVVRFILLCFPISLLRSFLSFSTRTPLINRSFSLNHLLSLSLSLQITVSSLLFLSLRQYNRSSFIVPLSLFLPLFVFLLILPLFFIFDPFSSLLTL